MADQPSATSKDKNPKGGLSAAGHKKFGTQPGVTNYSSASEGDKKRWVRWALRFTKTPKPLKDDAGKPTRYALMFHAWGEPVPTNEGAVKAVHAKAVARAKQLGMGQYEKAAEDFDVWLDEVIEQARVFSEKKRTDLAGSGKAQKDGSFPIENATDLRNALMAFGRSKDKAATKAHIIRRAKALGLQAKLPDGWK